MKCQVTLTGPSTPLAPDGAEGTISVGAAPECAWTASTVATWISDLTPTGGQGAASVRFKIAPNPAAAARQADIVVNGATARINQAAAACRFDLAPRSVTVPANGGTGAVTVTTIAECAWSAVSQESWITIASAKDNTGTATVSFTTLANAGAARTGTLTIAGQPVIVSQAAPGCPSVLEPATQNIAAAGGAGALTVTAVSGCTWTATSEVPWVAISGAATGSGNGVIALSIAPNTGAARSGRIAVGNQTATVVQDASASAPPSSCSYALNPTSQTVGSQGGLGSTTVTTSAGCAWTTTSNAAWIVVQTGAAGTGTDGVTFSIAPNTGIARSGTLTIAGVTFSVSQAAATTPCGYAVAPLTQSVPASAGAVTPLTVTTTASCTWTAASNASWIHVTAGASGTGSGSVSVTVDQNTGPQRSGTLTVAGETVTITQAAAPVPCAYSVAPLTPSVAAAGGGVSLTVTTTASCNWTAASNASWIHVTSGASGTGGGSVLVTVDQNTGAQRSGTLTVAGETVTVTQAAAVVACSYVVAPLNQSVGALGGAGTQLSVTTAAGCAWTAVSNTSWLQVTAGASGTGNGTVDFTVAANGGLTARSGTLTIGGPGAGQTVNVTVDQAALVCNFSISPDNQTVGASAGTGTSIAVTTLLPLCGWTAVANDSWLHLTGAAAGSGNGTVSWTYDANVGPQRTGTIGISGQTFTVTQTTGCTYMLSPSTLTGVSPTGVTGSSITVTTAGGCAWTAATSDNWLTITAGSGTGSGTATFDVLPNGTGSSRSGSITIGGQSFSVTQNP